MSSSPAPAVRLLSVESPGAEAREGEGLPRRHPLVANGDFIQTYDDSVTTLYESFMLSVRKFGIINDIRYIIYL